MSIPLKIDNHVLLAAKERAKCEGKHVGKVISDLARHTLAASSRAECGAEHKPIHHRIYLKVRAEDHLPGPLLFGDECLRTRQTAHRYGNVRAAPMLPLKPQLPLLPV